MLTFLTIISVGSTLVFGIELATSRSRGLLVVSAAFALGAGFLALRMAFGI